jgi:glycosyltransferase involved in cell wall biosynthesis
MKKIAIVTSHPIQYNAPLFKLMAKSDKVKPKVFYTWGQSRRGQKFDPDFGKDIEWDIPLLEDYEYTFVKNIAKDPGTHHFYGIINPTLNKEIEEWEPDAILIFGWSFQSHLHCLRYFKGKLPVLFRGDSTLLDELPGFRRGIRRIFLKWIYKHIDFALFVGTNNRNYFVQHGLREDQLVYAPHAIDNDRFAEPDDLYRQEAGNWRARLGIAETDVVVLFAGKFEPKKNPFFLLEMLKGIKSDQLKIIFTGNGILEQKLKKSAMTDSRIRFIDFQNQSVMPVVYRLSDVFILPSRGPGETWGLGANEAMASGCAVMLSEKTGGAIDLVIEEKNGIVFRMTDYEKCRQFIQRIISDRQELTDMKKTSRGLVQVFSYGRIVAAIEGIMTNPSVTAGSERILKTV